MTQKELKLLIREAVSEAVKEFEKENMSKKMMEAPDHKKSSDDEMLSELSMLDVSAWASKMGTAVKNFFDNDKTIAADWLQIAKNAVKPAALVLLMSALNSCATPEKLLQKYQDPRFQQEMRMKDPAYFKHIYAVVKDTSGKEKVVIRKNLLHDPTFFGKEQGPIQGTSKCLLGVGTCPTYAGTGADNR
jgi:hypothetical protein